MRFTTGTEVYQELIEAYHQATKGASPGESTPPRQQSTATAGWNDVLNLSAPDDDNPDADNILRSLGKGYELSDGMSVSDAESLEADKRTQMQELAARAKQKIELAATALNSACSADEEDVPRLPTRTFMHAHIQTHTYIHTCMHAYMHTYMHICIHTCIYACMHICLHAYMCTHTHTRRQPITHTGWVFFGI